MTLTTNEELMHLASSDNTNELTRRLARECLANRKVQPFGYVYTSKDGVAVNFGHELPFMPEKWNVTPVYTAPPAPAVPDELLDAMEEVIRISDRDHEAWDEAKAAITACRAAMLAAAPDGWIACSERMPDETQPVIVVSGEGVVQRTVYQFCDGVWSDWYDQHEHLNADMFTHWMPLPAAPEGGNG